MPFRASALRVVEAFLAINFGSEGPSKTSGDTMQRRQPPDGHRQMQALSFDLQEGIDRAWLQQQHAGHPYRELPHGRDLDFDIHMHNTKPFCPRLLAKF
jgi:hypothetical protein